MNLNYLKCVSRLVEVFQFWKAWIVLTRKGGNLPKGVLLLLKTNTTIEKHKLYIGNVKNPMQISIMWEESFFMAKFCNVTKQNNNVMFVLSVCYVMYCNVQKFYFLMLCIKSSIMQITKIETRLENFPNI